MTRRYLPVGYTKLTAPDKPVAIYRLQMPFGWSVGLGSMLWHSEKYSWWHPGRYVFAMSGGVDGRWWQFRVLWFYIGRASWKAR